MRRHAPATARNREPILAVLGRVLPAQGLLLEVASGTGEHAAFMTPLLPGIAWQPSDAGEADLAGIDRHAADTGCPRILRAIRLDASSDQWPIRRADAVFCCNMIHIAPWSAAEGLLAGAARILLEADAPLVLYGPFKRHGSHTAPSNASFDAGLRAQDRHWGVRCLDTELLPLAARTGFRLDETVAMPADNLTVVLRRVARAEVSP